MNYDAKLIKEVGRSMSDKKFVREEKIELQYPIDADGQLITHLTLRRPKVRDIQVLEAKGGDEFSKSVNLIANLTMLSPDQVMEMDMGTDFITVRDRVNNFLGLTQ